MVFAASTKKTYSSYLAMYYKFCSQFKISPVPISQFDLSRYVAFLSFRLKFSSIQNYLSVVRLLHLEAGFDNPLSTHYMGSIQKGTRRLLGDASSSKLPITPHILKGIHSLLSFSDPLHVPFWAACLVAFFSFFRKSNLLPPSTNSFDPSKQLSRSHLHFHADGLTIQVTWSKTIQYQERTLSIPLPYIKNSPFCPSTALWLAFKQGDPSNMSPFQYMEGYHLTFLTYPKFLVFLKQCLHRLGFDTSRYSGHSFRRGGASFALESGVPADLVQTQGDWRSDAYKLYIDPSLQARRTVALTMAKALQALV